MLFVIRFYDSPHKQAVRQQYLQAHIDWLDSQRDTILVAGSLREDDDAVPVGALWIVEAESRAMVTKLFETDPFWIHGLRESHEILHWSKAFPEEKNLV